MSRRKRHVPNYEPGGPLANQAYWESQGHDFTVIPDTEAQVAEKQAQRDAVRMRNSESVREMFRVGLDKR